MPIYEYRCLNGHTFEVIQSMSDDPVETCEVCGAPVERVFHPVAVHFKGSGFYSTDYAEQGQGRAAKDGDSRLGRLAASSTTGSSGSESEPKRSPTRAGRTSAAEPSPSSDLETPGEHSARAAGRRPISSLTASTQALCGIWRLPPGPG